MQGQSLQPINLDFEGHPVTAVTFRGKWCWIASQVGVAIGYEQGERFAAKPASEWADEFIEGTDFAVLRKTDLKDFNRLASALTETVSANSRKLTVLYESGLHLALQRTRKQAGKHLRRALAEKVLPQLVRDGRYDPERSVTAEGNFTPTHASDVTMRELDVREREVEERLAQLEIRKREMGAGALRQLVTTFRPRGRISEDILESLEVKAAEIESGESLIALMPPADERADWETPTQIAERNGVSVQKVGRIITALKLRGHPTLSWKYLNTPKDSNRTVACYRYAPEAVAQIEKMLGIAKAA